MFSRLDDREFISFVALLGIGYGGYLLAGFAPPDFVVVSLITVFSMTIARWLHKDQNNAN